MFFARPQPVTLPDLGADKLDRRHQRIGQHHRPEHVEAELGAGLRIGRNAARVVVRRAGDEPGAELLEDRGFAQPFRNLPLTDRRWRRRAEDRGRFTGSASRR